MQLNMHSTGNCTLVEGEDTPRCVCDHGFSGDDCGECTYRFTGHEVTGPCSTCVENYIGYNTDCNTLCVHGYASEPGGSNCTCYDDDVEGHWTGETCNECITGYLFDDCIECTLGTS